MTRSQDQRRRGARSITLAQIASDPGPNARRTRGYGRWRAASLIGVHVVAAMHIAHWHIAGKTLAPLEFNEVMHTLELGIVTAGFLLMALIISSTLIFGRFFCSWGCHILALQDLCAWMLRKLRIRTKPVRSRVLLLVGPGAMLSMFAWPQLQRVIEGRSPPRFHFRNETSAWASFVTDDFWRNLPGPWVAILTFAVCGFAIVYVLGTRSFCQYACPYGAIFGIADRFAPGRIKVDPDRCTACGVCTAVCESHVRVHDEIARHRRVVDPSCLKDLDCVAACPEGALAYGLTTPSLLRSFRPARRRLPYDFTRTEDMLMAVVFLASLLIFRGLYGFLPFLLSLAIGGILSYFAVMCLRLTRRPNVRLNGFQLRLHGRTTARGRVFVVLAVVVGLFTAHSALIRYHERMGVRALARATTLFEEGGTGPAVRDASRKALMHLEFCERWGLLTAPGHDRRGASACWGAGDLRGAEDYWRRAIDHDRTDQESRLDLAAALVQRGEFDRATPLLREVTSARAESARNAARTSLHRAYAWNMLGQISLARGDTSSAEAAFEAAAAERDALMDASGRDRTVSTRELD